MTEEKLTLRDVANELQMLAQEQGATAEKSGSVITMPSDQSRIFFIGFVPVEKVEGQEDVFDLDLVALLETMVHTLADILQLQGSAELLALVSKANIISLIYTLLTSDEDQEAIIEELTKISQSVPSEYLVREIRLSDDEEEKTD